MSTPNLTIDVQPVEGGRVVFLPLAAEATGQTAQFKLVIRLQITNHESKSVNIDAVRFSFPGSSDSPIDMMLVNVDIDPGKNQFWSNGVVTFPDKSKKSNAVYLNDPAPGKVAVEVSAKGFTTPVKVTMDLAPYKAQQPDNAFLFPFSQTDCRIGEYLVTSAQHWANGGSMGGQIYAHDITFQGLDENGKWSALLPNKDGKKNPDYRIWGKKIRAVADGIVTEVVDGVDTNPNPGSFPKPVPAQLAGNHYWVQHGDVSVLYAHMQKGLLNPNTSHVGAQVKAGEMLGLAGNSGNASGPHTHVQCQRASDGALRPLPFRKMWCVLEDKISPPDPKGPWVHMKGQGVPKDTVAIWAADSKPAWYPPGWGEIAYFGIKVGDYQDLFDRIVSSGYRPVWVDGYEVKGDISLNAIFRPENGPIWHARHGMDGNEYQAEFDKQKKAGKRLFNLTSYMDGGTIRYAAIWESTAAPAGHAYHGKTQAEHDTMSAAFKKEGMTPINVSVVSVDGKLFFAALWEKVDAGTWDLKTFLTPDQYQAEWDTQIKAGRTLAYLSAYQHNGGPRLSAVFQQKVAGKGGTVAKHGMSGVKMQSEYDKNLGEGLLTRVLAGYEQNGEATYAAAWREAPVGALEAAGGIG